MRPFPELITDRLRLRGLTFNDIPSIVKYANNEIISENILNIKLPYEPEDAIFWMNFSLQGFKNEERYVFAITLADSNEFIGAIGLHLNVGHDSAQLAYWIGEPFWGKGIMTEAAKAVVKYGFEALNLHKIYATHFPDNQSSRKILTNCGMVLEGELKDHYKVKGNYINLYHYGILNHQYYSS